VPKVEISVPAPDFGLEDLSGNEIRLADYRGRRNVLVVFNRGFT
jgi:peroxiredoxin